MLYYYAMPSTNPVKEKIRILKIQFSKLSKGKESLLKIINEVELSESIYNSNAIENSTLTLKETEKILMDLEIARNLSVREVFEAKNLAMIMQYVKKPLIKPNLTIKALLLLHQMLMNNIDDKIAGHFRQKGEYVRVGSHIAPPPEKVEEMIDDLLLDYDNNHHEYFLDKIAKFHLDFETIHPFLDGNGRMGRVLINYQLHSLGFPNIIIRNKEKQKYYSAFNDYKFKKDPRAMEKILFLALFESLHKRISYLKGEKIITLAEFSKNDQRSLNSLINLARRQTIPAFRERGVWVIVQNVR